MEPVLIRLQRDHEVESVRKPQHKNESATIGLIGISYENKLLFSCYTIENGGASSELRNKDRRIMPGVYELTYAYTSVPLPSQLNKKGLLLTKEDDPTFKDRRIFIHQGNYPQDTLGCILLVKNYNMEKKMGWGTNSVNAVGQFYKTIADLNPKKILLKIFDPETKQDV